MPDYRIIDIRPGAGEAALAVRVVVAGRTKAVDLIFDEKPPDLEAAIETAVADLPPESPLAPEQSGRRFLRPILDLCRGLDDGLLSIDSAAMQMLLKRIDAQRKA